MGQGPHLGQGTPILFRASENRSEPLNVVICTLGHLGRRPFEWGAEPQEYNKCRTDHSPRAQGNMATGAGVPHIYRLQTRGQPILGG